MELLMKQFLIILFLLITPAFASDLTHVDEILKGKLIHGEAIEADALKGKVILFEYWGFNWPPCLEALPHLQVLQDKFAKSGKFAVISSHALAYNKRAIEGILKKNKITFPVYQKLFLKKAPPVDGIPHVILFDQEGKIVEQDFEIENLEEKIKKLISADKKWASYRYNSCNNWHLNETLFKMSALTNQLII